MPLAIKWRIHGWKGGMSYGYVEIKELPPLQR